MDTQMDEDLDILAKRMGISHEEAVQKLKYNYDGYHFTWPSPDIYNPFSLLNAFADGRLDSYWFGSGTPTYYKIKNGDTLGAIAAKYGVRVKDLQNWNGLRGTNISAGKRLKIYK